MGVAAGPMLLLQAAGAGMSAYGAYQGAKADKASLTYQSQVAANNAALAEQQAQFAMENGVSAEQNQRLRTAAMVSTQRASTAANGVAVDEGSAAEVAAGTKYIGERDALTIRDNASREAWGYRTQEQGYKDEGAMLAATARSVSPRKAAFASLLTSSGSVASSWYNMRSKGAV